MQLYFDYIGKIYLLSMLLDLSEIPRHLRSSPLFALPQTLFTLMNLTLRLFLPSLLLAATCLGAVEKPNLVVFISDDLGRFDTSIHGSKDVRTPTMDLLAARRHDLRRRIRGLAILLPKPLLLAYRLDACPSRGSPQP